jgi:hypothetical protein
MRVFQTNSDRSYSRIIAGLLAIIGPAIILGLAAQWFTQAPATVDSVSTGKQMIDEIEARVRDEKPEVVLIGNSMVNSGVDLELLGEILGARVTTLHVNGSKAPTWYLLLKNRVFAQGHRPHAVVIVGASRAMLGNQIEGYVVLEHNAHRGSVEEVVDAKTSGEQPGPVQWKWAKLRRDQLRANILDSIRRWTTSMVFANAIAADGAADADTWAKAQLEEVFGDAAAMSGVTPSRVIPVVEIETQEEQAEAIDVEDTFIPDFVKLAAEHDARIVFARVPIAPSGPGAEDAVEPLMKRSLSWLSGQDAGYLDMRTIGLTDTDFVDYLHLNKTGRRKLTKALGAHLVSLDLMGDESLPRVVNRSSNPLVRSGPLPVVPGLLLDKATLKKPDCSWQIPYSRSIELSGDRLSRLGARAEASPILVMAAGEPIAQTGKRVQVNDGRCSNQAFVGQWNLLLSAAAPDTLPPDLQMAIDPDFPSVGSDGAANYWLFPGQTVTTTFEEPWPEAAEAFEVDVLAIQTDAGSPLTVSIDGGPSVTAKQTGHRIEARIPSGAPTESWTLRLSVPSDGAPTLIQSWSVGKDLAKRWLIGSPNALVTRRAIGGYRAKMTYAAAPPPFEASALKPVGDGTFRFDGKAFYQLGDARILHKTTIWGCSPVRVTHNGSIVGKPHKKCDELLSFAPGAYCHIKNKVLRHPPRDTDATQDPQSFSLTLDPIRKCGKGQWLYPGDQLIAQPWPVDTTAMPAGIRSIAVIAAIMERDNPDRQIPVQNEPLIEMTLKHGDQPILTRTLRRAQLTGEPLTIAVDPPLAPGDTPVSLVFETRPDGPFIVVISAAVSEVLVPTGDQPHHAEGAAQ